MVVQVVAQTNRQQIPDIIFLDQAEELLGVVCGYDGVQWIRLTDQRHNLVGAAGNRLAAILAQVSEQS